ncbi:hypothetical protein L2E82_10413 [Cichorium intybus]|uniref:Uncharacterized protein n=1 Tax=Cichorium intybus TaxID=13427 RepID=A0ACB9GCG9_CICIN|nr:hypothetical protein L2E82_10413 [Cichorium intybus]
MSLILTGGKDLVDITLLAKGLLRKPQVIILVGRTRISFQTTSILSYTTRSPPISLANHLPLPSPNKINSRPLYNGGIICMHHRKQFIQPQTLPPFSNLTIS